MGKATRMVMPTLTLDDIIAIRGRSDVSLTTSPFGVTPKQYENSPPIYLKVNGAMNWKGKRGAEFERVAPPAVVAGLKRAIAISKACAGIRGTVLYNGKLYPKKCIEQKRKAGKST